MLLNFKFIIYEAKPPDSNFINLAVSLSYNSNYYQTGDMLRFSTEFNHKTPFSKLSINATFTIARHIIFPVEVSDRSEKCWSRYKTQNSRSEDPRIQDSANVICRSHTI